MYPTLNPKLTDTMFDFPEEARPQRIQRVMPNGYAQHAQTLRLWARHAAPPGRWQTSCTGQRTCESRGGGFVVIWGFGVGGEVAAASHALVVGVGKVGALGKASDAPLAYFVVPMACLGRLCGGWDCWRSRREGPISPPMGLTGPPSTKVRSVACSP